MFSGVKLGPLGSNTVHDDRDACGKGGSLISGSTQPALLCTDETSRSVHRCSLAHGKT